MLGPDNHYDNNSAAGLFINGDFVPVTDDDKVVPFAIRKPSPSSYSYYYYLSEHCPPVVAGGKNVNNDRIIVVFDRKEERITESPSPRQQQ